MMIGATYTQNGADWTGLTPTINIYNALSKAKVINAAVVPEIAEGGYRYEFAAYDPSKDYYWKIDGGAAITNNKERYRRGWSGLAGAVPDAQAGHNGGLPTVDANDRIAGIRGTLNVLDDLHNISTAEVNAAADVALVDYGGPTKAEMDAGHGLLATPAEVNAEVADVLKVDTVAEISQEAPPEEPTMEQMLNYLYRMWRNKTTATGDEVAMYDNAGTTKLVKAVLTKVGSLFTKGKMGSGA